MRKEKVAGIFILVLAFWGIFTPSKLYGRSFNFTFTIPKPGEVQIRWIVEGSNNIRFNIYRKTVNEEYKKLNKKLLVALPPPIAEAEGKTSGVFWDKGLIIGQRYFYKVEIVDSKGKVIERSEDFEFVANDGKPPSAIKKINVESTEDLIKISWEPLDDPEVTSYRIYKAKYFAVSQSKDISEIMNLIAEVGVTTNEYIDRDVKKGVLYYYTVTAVDPYSGEGRAYYYVPVTLKDTESPQTARDFKAELRNNNEAVLTWKSSPSDDVSMYLIFRGIEDESQGMLLTRVLSNEKTYYKFIDRLNINSAFEYFYYIVAVDFAGNKSNPTEKIFMRLPDHRPPARPVITGLKIDDGKITISWAPSPEKDIAGYNIYRSEIINKKETAPRKLNKELQKDNKYIDTTVNGGVVYRYYITAVDSSDNESAYSTGRTVRAFATVNPVVPEGVVVENSEDGKPVIRWNSISSKDLRGFFVYRSTSEKSGFVKISGLIKGVSFTDRSAIAFTEVWYAVRAFYRGGRLSELSKPVKWQRNFESEVQKQ